ncbi:hypothetical protein [Paraliobacillus sp. JSM ZJ581]|uniref:hypothetical protein n=1 Tax=Paraliobacillus sp. JSM ZJ581 TaxID=3342118 RepID=UPI0035A8C0C9
MSSLSYLRYSKRSVSNQLYSKRSLVDDTEEKIARLKHARSELSSVLSDVRSVNGSIKRFTISSSS